MLNKRITLFLGHYGSGKTNVAVNYAINLKKQVKAVSIYDLDIVNPYFRTVDAVNILKDNGVELVVSPYAETNVDIPAMNSKSYQMVDDLNRYAVVDIGGDDRGALALGRFSDKIKLENNYEMLLVVNKYRPETRDLDGILNVKDEIERTARINFTGVVNNSNLGNDTTANTIFDSFSFINEVSKKTGLPIKFTAVRKDLTEKVKEKENKILPIELIKYGDWL
ncbi:MAG: hypothetical protein IJR66_01150 [Clostridia bacterium]|nr:hypothetical protein [Clostridia bacterium]